MSLTLPTCSSCGALPEVIVGLPVAVTFARSGDGYVATVSTLLADLSAVDDGDVVFSCECEEETLDADEVAAVSAVLAQIHELAAPSLDVSL